ncbi:Coiled-coil domain-containing protein 175 [Channa argus]|uniref:Coiled-coil domain-containing protein 175 n=2 Tax=Channa argus TaxID=215402 RepID=A0A6G1PAZ7_CHAAH|nr:Coiled-coil domain-containing protein 175 [Channa argus]
MVALEHLTELDKQLKEEGAQFGPEACLHLTEITAALSELEANRHATHERLEVETIENSKLRHQISNIRERMIQEIMADMAAARASNVEEIEQLQKALTTISQIQEATAKRDEELLNQNEALYPELEQVKSEHEKSVAVLNDQITLKYSLQMQLDQKQEQIEELNCCIAAAEKDKIKLEQKIALEREAFCAKKDNLSREVDETIVKIQQQKQAIKIRRKELEIVNNKKKLKQQCLQEVMTDMAKRKSSIQKLTLSKGAIERQLEEEMQKHRESRKQSAQLKKELFELEEAFSLTIKHLKEEITMVEDNIEAGHASRVLLVDLLPQIYEIFKKQHDEENEVRAEHVQISRQFARSKLQLEGGIASIVKHSTENKEMNKQIRELVEASTINKRVFNSNQEELCSNMDIEKKNISHFEEEKNRLSRLLEEAKKQQEKYLAKIMSDISNTRKRYEELRQEGATLQQRQPKSTDVELLMRHITKSEVEYREIESKHKEEIEQFMKEAEIITRSNEEKQRELEEKEEFLKGVEAKMNEEQTRYQRLSALISELRGRRSDLELSIKRLKEETSALLQPKEEKKIELKALRSSFMDMLDKQASELKAVEISIYDNKVELEQVNMENSRLHLCIRQMTDDISRARQNKERYWQEIQKFNEDINALSDSLQKAWREDILVTKDCQNSDGVLLLSISALLKYLKTRKHQLENVSTLLHQQMLDFSKRLGDKTVFQHHLVG